MTFTSPSGRLLCKQSSLLRWTSSPTDACVWGGVRWVEPEFAAINEDYQTRRMQIDEQIAVVRMLWTQESVAFQGRWHHIDAMGIRPLPVGTGHE